MSFDIWKMVFDIGKFFSRSSFIWRFLKKSGKSERLISLSGLLGLRLLMSVQVCFSGYSNMPSAIV